MSAIAGSLETGAGAAAAVIAWTARRARKDLTDTIVDGTVLGDGLLETGVNQEAGNCEMGRFVLHVLFCEFSIVSSTRSSRAFVLLEGTLIRGRQRFQPRFFRVESPRELRPQKLNSNREAAIIPTTNAGMMCSLACWHGGNRVNYIPALT